MTTQEENRKKRREDVEGARAMEPVFKAREWWDGETLRRHQEKALHDLVSHAVNHSPFYRDLYRSRGIGPGSTLEDLPPVTKSLIMEHFDEVVTDRRLRLEKIRRYMETLREDDYYLGKYRVLTTAGSSGHKGVFLYDRLLWRHLHGSVTRASRFMDLPADRKMRITSIGAGNPLHLSYRRAISREVDHRFYQRLEATAPLEDLVREMNAFMPEYIHTYPSVASLLAHEQTAGRLRISPRVMVTGAEPLPGKTVEKIRRAWNIIPFNSYSATEGVLGIACTRHQGIHLFEDLGIYETVDEEGKPVPAGQRGHKIFFTNLYQYTQPLIRYEISDILTLSPRPCPCGRPFRLVKAIEGRNDETLFLKGTAGGKIAVPPIVFRGYLDELQEVKEYQVVQHGETLRVRVVAGDGPGKKDIPGKIRNFLERELASLGVEAPSVRVTLVDKIERRGETMGKFQSIRKEQESGDVPSRNPVKNRGTVPKGKK